MPEFTWSSVCRRRVESCRPNEKRINALRVLQETERHVPEVLNKDEFLRRLTTVLLSNDPIARAITLRYGAQQLRAVIQPPY